jgi:hypothetical protein
LAAFFSLALAFFNAFFSFLTGTDVVVRFCLAVSLVVETSWATVLRTDAGSADVGFFVFFG